MAVLDFGLHLAMGSALAGVFVIGALVAGATSPVLLLGAAVAGMAVAIPLGMAVKRTLVTPRARPHAENDIANG